MILSVQNITKSFGADTVLKDVSFQMEKNEKFAVVGPNGCGKSTLLRVIVGEETADGGQVVFDGKISYGYLSQYQDDVPREGAGVYEETVNARADLLLAETHLRELETKMRTLTGDALNDLLEEYHTAQDDFERRGGLTFRSEAVGILKGLGFSEDEFEKPLNVLSGGQKTRAALGRLLMKHPDVLLLDEPINHLDLHAIEWLEGYLNKYDGALILVAHDRYFMDRICDRVFDLSRHTGEVYKGNYTNFVREKAERDKAYRNAYDRQQQEIKHQEQVISKLKQFNREKSIKRAESREKMLSKIERLDKPTDEATAIRFAIEPKIKSGNDVMRVENLGKAFGEKRLFDGLSFDLFREEHLAIIGDNGTGKTTLLKIINGIALPDRGEISFGTNVTIGYYDQEQQELSDEKTLFQEMQDAYPRLNDTEIRNTLALFLFTGDDVFKKIGMLSGGERGRVSLAKLMLSGANLLILDEPTNHLDMESKEILENALNAYTGTLLYVSHDRYFINRTATRILEIETDGHALYVGNYDEYLRRKAYLSERTVKDGAKVANGASGSDVATKGGVRNSGVTVKGGNAGAKGEAMQADDASSSTGSSMSAKTGKADWQEQKRLAAEKQKKERELSKIEARIDELETEIAAIDGQFDDPAVATNSAKLNELSAKKNTLQAELDELYELWDSAAS